MPTSGIIRLPAANTYYEIRGDGPPLLMIAGLASDSQSWFSIADRLAEHFRLILFDNRHCGRTRTVPEAGAVASLADYADDAAALLHALGIDRAHVLGHSLGGLIAGTLAARHPETVDRLVLASCPAMVSARNRTLFAHWEYLRAAGGADREFFLELFRWLVTPGLFEDEAFLQGAIEYGMAYPHAQSDGDFSIQARLAATCDNRALFRAIAAPTLVIAGERDIMFPPDEIRALAELVPGARLRFIPDAAHSLVIEGAEPFCREVAAFLA